MVQSSVCQVVVDVACFALQGMLLVAIICNTIYYTLDTRRRRNECIKSIDSLPPSPVCTPPVVCENGRAILQLIKKKNQ
jgi:hypothetical protein